MKKSHVILITFIVWPFVDLFQGRDLTFETAQQSTLPEFLRKSPIVSVRITDVDESPKEEIV